MLLELLLFLIVIWIWSSCNNNTDEEILIRLQRDIHKIVPNAEYQLISSQEGRTFVVDKKRIYLVIRDHETGKIYDYQTLLYVTIHELAHILTPDISHSHSFRQMEKHLLQRAVEKDLLPERFIPDPRYPCEE